MIYAHGNSLCDDGTVLATFESHWQAVAAMLRLSNPDFRSIGGDSDESLAKEADIKKRINDADGRSR